MVALFGRYSYVRELGQGATARVIEARDAHASGQSRALKLLPPDEGSRAAWEQARLMRVSGPHLASVHELLRVDTPISAPFSLSKGAWVLVEDLAPGERADACLERLHDDMDALLDAVLRVAHGAAQGLLALHRAGLVHGDVKPENLLCTEGAQQVTLIDLGVARAPGQYTVVDGTPEYLPAEAWSGRCGFETDVYALGATLSDLWSGVRAETVSAGAPVRLPQRSLAPAQIAAAPRLATLIDAMLASDPHARPGSALRVLERLAPLLEHRFGPGRYGAKAVAPAGGLNLRPSPLSLPLVGHGDELRLLATQLEGVGVLQVCGPPGSGRSRVVREAVRAVQLSCARRAEQVPSFAVGLDGLDRLAQAPLIVHVPAAAAGESERAARLAAAQRRAGASVRLVFEREVPDPSLSPDAVVSTLR